MAQRLFISYPHAKDEIVSKVWDYLTEKGYKVWKDTSEIHGGDKWREEIHKGLTDSSGVVAFLSRGALQRPDGVCLAELHIARGVRHAAIKPVLLEKKSEIDEGNPPKSIFEWQYMDMSDWGWYYGTEGWDDYFAGKMDELVASLESDRFSGFWNEMEDLRKYLKPVEDDAKVLRLLPEKFVGREWLQEEVRKWIGEERGAQTLILYGEPGTGKSAFAASLYDNERDVVTPIFFEASSKRLHKVDDVVKTLAFQLASSPMMDEYRKQLCKICRNNGKTALSRGNRGTDLINLLLVNPLVYCIKKGMPNQVLVFDGLDETSEEVIEAIAEICGKLPDCIKVLMTSRRSKVVQEYFHTPKIIYQDEYREENRRDVKEFFSKNMGVTGDTLEILAEKSDNNFQYATCLFHEIENHNMDLKNPEQLPNGMKEFYGRIFRRIYPGSNNKNYKKDRLLYQLLLADENLPQELVRLCLKLEKEEMEDLLKKLYGSILISDQEKEYFNAATETVFSYRSLAFEHQSIADWLRDKEASGSFHVFTDQAYERLLEIAKQVLTGEIEVEENLYRYCEENQIRWMIEAGKWNDLEDMLLNSFCEEDILQIYRSGSYRGDTDGAIFTGLALSPDDELLYESGYFKQFCEQLGWTEQPQGHEWEIWIKKVKSLWQYADDFSNTRVNEARTERIGKKILSLTEHLSKDTEEDEALYWIRMHASFAMLDVCMKSSRYKEVLFTVFDRFIMDFKQIRSEAVVIHACACLEHCRSRHIDIPEKTQNICERMKLLNVNLEFKMENTYGMVILPWSEPETWLADELNRDIDLNCCGHDANDVSQYKKLCILDDEQEEKAGFADCKKRRRQYNTRKLQAYLFDTDEEDMDFVRACADQLVDISQACHEALDAMIRTEANGNGMTENEEKEPICAEENRNGITDDEEDRYRFKEDRQKFVQRILNQRES